MLLLFLYLTREVCNPSGTKVAYIWSCNVGPILNCQMEVFGYMTLAARVVIVKGPFMQVIHYIDGIGFGLINFLMANVIMTSSFGGQVVV